MRGGSLCDPPRMDLMVWRTVIPHARRACRDLASIAGNLLGREDPDTLRVRDDNWTEYHQMHNAACTARGVINPPLGPGPWALSPCPSSLGLGPSVSLLSRR